MSRTWLPTLCIAVMVAAGTWIARDYVPSKQALVAENEDREPPKKQAAGNERSLDTDIEIDIDIPRDVNDVRVADPKSTLGTPKVLPPGTNEQATPLVGVQIPDYPLEQTKEKTVQAHLKIDLPTGSTTKTIKKSRPGAESKKPTITLPTTYLVKQRDSFWFIAKQHYGNPLYYRALYQFNRGKIKQPDRMSVGSLVAIPTVAQLRASFPHLCPRTADK